MWITIIVIGVLAGLAGLLFLNARKQLKSINGVRDSDMVKILTDLNFQNNG